MSKFKYLFLILLLSSACKTEDNSPITTENLFFGHRGSGADVYDGKYIENTLTSVVNALDLLDGCEVDIQMSKDGTIWLYHDDNLGHFCDTVQTHAICIPTTNDGTIESIEQCRGDLKDRIYKLEEVLKLLCKPEYKQSFLSLDVKGYFDSLCFPSRNAPETYFTQMGEELVRMVEHYNLENQIIVETAYTTFLNEVKNANSNIRCHLIGYEDFEEVSMRAIEHDYDGVSFSLFDESISKDAVEEVKNKGLEVQVWPINDSILLQKAMDMKPFSMQISKLKFAD